jgi:sensor histidine kinase YesM
LETGGYETVRLSDELLFIENYLDIQLERFDRSFSFRKELPPEWAHLRLPPMVLQPLVENAVKYGVGQRESGGVIVLRVEPQGKGIYVEVADNGPGVAAHTGGSTGIGLKNTDLRLRRLYGPEAALQVSASPQGFRVGFWLPVAS